MKKKNQNIFLMMDLAVMVEKWKNEENKPRRETKNKSKPEDETPWED